MTKNKHHLYAGVDLGGTSLQAVITDDHGEVLGARTEKTFMHRGDPGAIIDLIVHAVHRAAEKAGVETSELKSVGIGAAGAVNLETGVVEFAANLGWKDVPLAARVKKGIDVPTFLDNDVRVAMFGEHQIGAARDAQTAIAIWIGTGIGGGLVLGGRLFSGSRGVAGEIGHVCLRPDGPLCGCGRNGCAEAFGSRTAMEREVRARVQAGRASAVTRIMEEAGKTRMTSSVVEKALAEKDAVMIEVLARAQDAIALLTANLVNVLDPEVVVLGGGLVERLGEVFVGPIRTLAYDRFLQQNRREEVRIVPARLADRAGSIGAALMGRKRLRKE